MANICPCTFGNSISKALFGLRDVKKLNCDEPEQTTTATITAREVQRTNNITSYQESPWLYLITFRPENGENVQLQTTEEVFGVLKDGQCGKLTWQGETLVSFTPEEGGKL